MMDLNDLRLFVTVMAQGSFSKAARELGMPLSTLSTRIGRLEKGLGTRLLQRTTRRQSLTESGARFLARAQRVVAEADEAERELLEVGTEPRGSLRITAPRLFSERFLGPVLVDFSQRLPHVELELGVFDHIIDLVGEGYDAAIRVGMLTDSSLIAHRLGQLLSRGYAAPKYLAAAPPLRGLRDLSGHRLVPMSASRNTEWRVQGRQGKSERIAVKASLAVNSFPLVCEALVAGLGVGMLPSFLAEEHVARGALVPVLPRVLQATVDVVLVHPGTRIVPGKLRAFIDMVTGSLQRSSAWQQAKDQRRTGLEREDPV